MKKTFAINQFVREQTFQEMAEAGGVVAKDVVGKDLLYAFQSKMYEDVEEAIQTSDFEQQTEGLADALEALHAIAKVLGIDWSSVASARVQTAKQKGSYNNGTYIESITIDEKSELARVIADNTGKYPEI